MPTPIIDLTRVPKEHQDEAKQLLAAYQQLVEANPLMVFEPHSDAQRTFLAAVTRIVAAFAGNRFGKTTALVIKGLCQVLSREDLPEHLVAFKQVEAPCHGWILCPTEDKIFDSLKPALQKWCPPHALKGGRWDKAFNGERMQISFANGSTIAFKTYKQDASTLGGADLDFVGYDEPPPKGHRNECLARMARKVREWYAMTPLRVNVAWIRRDIWRNRESPDITVVRGEIYENPTLSKDEIDYILSQYDEIERQARERGDFMDLSGLVYARFGQAAVPDPTRQFVKTLDRVVGIDPGIRNAAIIFGGFDHHNVGWIWDELLIKDGTPTEYIAGIDRTLAEWGLRRDDCMFVIDPAARQRSQATGDTVQTELARLGLNTVSGIRDREVGQQQIRDRLKHSRLKIAERCLGLRDEADEFAYPLTDAGVEEDRGAADDSPYHRLATLRYLVMHRPWYPDVEDRAGLRNLGWQPGSALPAGALRPAVDLPPMGALS